MVGALLIGYVALLLLTLAAPSYVAPQRVRLVPLATIIEQFGQDRRTFLTNVPGNIAAFAPLGLLAPLWDHRMHSAGRIALFGLLLSGSIELLQLTLTYRVADIDDLLLNVLGAIAGYSLYEAARRLSKPAD